MITIACPLAIWTVVKLQKRLLIREAQEEVSVELKPSSLELVHMMHRQVDDNDLAGHERIDMFFEVRGGFSEPENAEPEKCSKILWCNIHELPERMIPEVRFALKNIVDQQVYSDFNFN